MDIARGRDVHSHPSTSMRKRSWTRESTHKSASTHRRSDSWSLPSARGPLLLLPVMSWIAQSDIEGGSGHLSACAASLVSNTAVNQTRMDANCVGAVTDVHR